MEHTHYRRVFTLDAPKPTPPEPPPAPVVAQKQPSTLEVYTVRFHEWCKEQGFQDWALVSTALLACIVSTVLTIRLSIGMGQGQSVALAFMFGVLWEMSKYTFAWAGIAHPHRNIRIAACITTGALIVGSMVASVTWLSKSIALESERTIASSVEFQDIKRQRDVIDRRINNLGSLAESDAAKNYRARALATDGKIANEMGRYTALGKEQTKLLSAATEPGAYLIPFAVVAFMLEIIGVLALALWRYRWADFEEPVSCNPLD